MPPRTSWTGSLKLSLITIPVRLYSAVVSTAKVRLNMLHRDCNQRIHYLYDCPVHGTIDKEEVTKGYQYQKDHYVVLDKETLEQVKLETTKVLEIVQFIDEQQLDPIFLDSPYYLAPDGPVATEAFAVLRASMWDMKRIALGRLTLSGREHMVAISPRQKGLLVYTLHYAKEVREEAPYFEGIDEPQLSTEEIDLARQLIASRTRPFAPEEFHDRYDDALLEVVKAKVAGREPEVVSIEEPGKVVDFMEALKRSLAAEEEEKEPGRPRGKAKRVRSDAAVEREPKGKRKGS
jgi:DNA end-binding protein Ku